MTMNGQTVLITGGTGSFGKAFVRTVLARYKPRKVIVFSRDEFKQVMMERDFAAERTGADRLRFFLGDVRDKDRLYRAFSGVDVVVHAAALKQVPTLEYNPFEAVKTNVMGAENIINAAIDRGVKKVIALSTDKAVNPVNLYGATKLCAEKLFLSGNAYAAAHPTRFSVVRYGNVVGSRGSVIPFFMEKKDEGVLPVTHADMTRFWITLKQGVDLVLKSLLTMKGGEIFVPKIPSMKVMDLVRAIAPRARVKIVGIRPGEKLHEMLMTEDDARRALEFKEHFVVLPIAGARGKARPGGKKLKPGFSYASDTNDWWLTVPQLQKMAREEVPTER